MKRAFVCFFICGLLMAGLALGFSSVARAGEFFDDFNGGNLDGWWFAPNLGGAYGAWQTENGALAQYKTGDSYRALVKDVILSTQVIQAQVNVLGGYAGFVFWHHEDHYVVVHIYAASRNSGCFFIEGTQGIGPVYRGGIGHHA